MNRFVSPITGVVGLLMAGAVVWLAASCGSTMTPFLVQGVEGTGNDPPSLTFLEPNGDLTSGQGDNFLIRWTDTDRDNNASISFELVEADTNDTILLVDGLEEDDLSGPDSHTVSTTLIPTGAYNLRGVIDDGVNDPVEVFAMTEDDATERRVVVTVVEQGQGPPTVPPQIYVEEPAFNLSVAQDDIMHVVVQPTAVAPDPADPEAAPPFDPDSDIRLWVLLDLDQDPDNDDPANPVEDEIIVLREQTIPQNANQPIEFDIDIDLTDIPPRVGGEPYYIRASVDDQQNQRVHRYATGSISVVGLASGVLDLDEIGREKAGVMFYGFNPGANTGSSITTTGDFDEDGVADLLFAARYGNPVTAGPVGEAYLVYGHDGVRFGGAIAANTVSETVPGVLFAAPAVMGLAGGESYTNGITDVNFIPDLTADGRPELFFGMSHVDGAEETMDFDPGDLQAEADPEEIQVQVYFEPGSGTVTSEGEETDFAYTGMYDTTIDTLNPTTQYGADADIRWSDDRDGGKEYALLKFVDVLDYVPHGVEDMAIDSINAVVTMRVFDVGDGAQVWQSLSDFTERTTYSDYSVNGDDPEADVDYDIALGQIDAEEVAVVQVNVTPIFQLMLEGLLDSSDNEIRLLFEPIPADEADDPNPTGVRSSEFRFDQPTLTITYNRLEVIEGRGCYPDDFVNNVSDIVVLDSMDYFYGGGMAVIINSQNRDSDDVVSPINPDRLENTMVDLELAGQRNTIANNARADNEACEDIGNDVREPERIAGARFMAGWYDYIDSRLLNQPPREGLFGDHVASVGDLNLDGLGEFIISAPRNERYYSDLLDTYGYQSTHWHSTEFTGSIIVIPGANYNLGFRREDNDGAASIPVMRDPTGVQNGNCSPAIERDEPLGITDSFEVFAEDMDDWLGGAESAGDFNLDGLDDIVCGAPLNDYNGKEDTGAVYVLYGRAVQGDYVLSLADDPILRTPMLRLRGLSPGDKIGWRQTSGLDVNGDRIDDVFLSSPTVDYGPVARSVCTGDFDSSGAVNNSDEDAFESCMTEQGEEGVQRRSLQVLRLRQRPRC